MSHLPHMCKEDIHLQTCDHTASNLLGHVNRGHVIGNMETYLVELFLLFVCKTHFGKVRSVLPEKEAMMVSTTPIYCALTCLEASVIYASNSTCEYKEIHVGVAMGYTRMLASYISGKIIYILMQKNCGISHKIGLKISDERKW